MMLVQVLAAALVSEKKTASFPASVDSIPTSANREDHVSMATLAARKCRHLVAQTTRVLACEVLQRGSGTGVTSSAAWKPPGSMSARWCAH